MKLRIATWGGMIVLGTLLHFDVFSAFQELIGVLVQACFIAANIYFLFKSNKPRKFESDDILDC